MKTTFNIPLILDDENQEVKFYPYRTAYVVNSSIFAEMDRTEASEIEYKLAEMAHKQPDNHTCYSIQDRWRLKSTIYVMCHDLITTFGMELKEERW